MKPSLSLNPAFLLTALIAGCSVPGPAPCEVTGA